MMLSCRESLREGFDAVGDQRRKTMLAFCLGCDESRVEDRIKWPPRWRRLEAGTAELHSGNGKARQHGRTGTRASQ